MKNVLFVCSQNRLRSPTAETVFSNHAAIEVTSAGTKPDADNPLTSELVTWADIIFVMERTHRRKLQQRFRSALQGQRIICLDIPDHYAFMDPALIALLHARVTPHLPKSGPHSSNRV
ncbi:phosphotyrosine protein phosphatase [Sphingomonas populi]|uniref:Phosphotyrosine protein phosphatase n=1 Tax=Sphingomonas populi TaxID=2484750 RepID=A0A4Q6Y0X2_9SPHN|nr:low molecular weight protein tyrosine phosphatase family protein [Sphingomonas populi]RZF65931.1 phosphotyrosine protein phosphatase [Sphingomonas populi]